MRHVLAPPTQRLQLEDAQRKTALATVTGHASGGFLLDRTIYHAADARYHHLQPEDRGHILADGHKLKIPRVFWDQQRRIVHRTTGPLPPVGAKAQLHLDADRRAQQARAHTAMHLLAAAVIDARGELLEAPRVVGGGEARLHARFREPPAQAVPRVLHAAQAAAAARVDVTSEWAPRDLAAKRTTHHLVPFDTIAPDEPTLRLVRIGETNVMPCDAPLVANTRDIASMRVTLLQPRGDTARFGVRVA